MHFYMHSYVHICCLYTLTHTNSLPASVTTAAAATGLVFFLKRDCLVVRQMLGEAGEKGREGTRERKEKEREMGIKEPE